jgi:hypothetical protein
MKACFKTLFQKPLKLANLFFWFLIGSLFVLVWFMSTGD